jgi:hypothetical protein
MAGSPERQLLHHGIDTCSERILAAVVTGTRWLTVDCEPAGTKSEKTKKYTIYLCLKDVKTEIVVSYSSQLFVIPVL